jgi:membrane fusion protein, heavy metal efflux system
VNPRLLILPCLMMLACQRPAPAPQATSEPEEAAVSATRWSRATELFVEYPVLAQGKPSRFAIHLTRLDTFKAIRAGRVEVHLAAPGQTPAVFAADAPSRPGIFGVTVTPPRVGPVELSFHFHGEGIDDTHSLGEAKVVTTRPPAKEEAPGEEISFLKEQQWTLDFATALVESRALRQSLRIPAEVTARASGEAAVDAPFDGRLVLEPSLAPGVAVTAGQPLANLVLPAPTLQDPASLELARTEANNHLEYARRDRARAERLVQSGAAPAKRLDEARVFEANAAARLAAAEARLKQYESSRNAAQDDATRRFVIRAPIAGVIQSVKTSTGSTVKAGDLLFEIVDLDNVYVSAIVPESEFPRMRQLSGAELEIPGVDQPRPLPRLITVGRVVDSASRTFPVIYAFDNRARLIAINQTVYTRLLFAASERRPVVPESALVDDNGNPILYVQLEGEAFARRPLKLGQREGGMVEILEGVSEGERIVTRGAHLIRLSTLSSQAPAHGHVH